jgi:chlorobactene lauroyltransferase
LKAKHTFHRSRKNPPGAWLVYNLLTRRSMSRAFSGVWVHAEPAALKLRERPDLPVLYTPTHTSWWDGYMAGMLNRTVFKQDAYLMMEEMNLARYPFFTWIGVYGVDRDNPRSALASVEYSVSLLTEKPGRSVWVFPQGTVTHPDKRPLGVYGGTGNIVRRVGRCAVVPVALRYEFRLEQAPEAFARVGEPLKFDPAREPLASREIIARIEAAMVQADDALHADLISGSLGCYRRVLSGRGSANHAWDAVLRLVGRLRQAVPGR